MLPCERGGGQFDWREMDAMGWGRTRDLKIRQILHKLRLIIDSCRHCTFALLGACQKKKTKKFFEAEIRFS